MQPETKGDTARARFFIMDVQNMARSEKEGRPIFESREMVEIKIPGDKHYSWEGPANEQMLINGQRVDSRQRFPTQYAAFKRGEQTAVTGTPLEMWPNAMLTSARVAELKAINIFSVEDLASVSDSSLGKMGMGARELREQARAYITAAKDGAANAKLSAEVARLTEMVNAFLAGGANPVDVKAAELAVPVTAAPPQDKALEDCTDDELKAYIKRESGKGIPGNPSRETLLNRAAELAQSKAA